MNLKTGLTTGAAIVVMLLAATNTQAASTKENIRVFASTNVEQNKPYLGARKWKILIMDADGKVVKTCPKHRHCWTSIKNGSAQLLNRASGKLEAERIWQTFRSRDDVAVFIEKKYRKK